MKIPSAVRLSLALAALVATPAFADHRDHDDHREEALRLADDAHELLAFLEEDARFLADGAIQVGDSEGWHRFQAMASQAGNVAFAYQGYGQNLANDLYPVSAVDQQYAFDRQGRRQLELTFVRLRNPPAYFVDKFDEYRRLDQLFAEAVATPPADPNDEPDVPGRWQCTAMWQMNGVWMRFRGEGDSRNAAKAAALQECTQPAGRFCQIESCDRLAPLRRR